MTSSSWSFDGEVLFLCARNLLSLRRCVAEGLVQGEGFATDASLIKADPQYQRSRAGESDIDRGDPAQASRPVREYLAALEQVNPVPSPPKRISLTDPAATWTAAAGPAIFVYSTNYLIDLKLGMIVDVEASAVTKTAEVEATKVLIRIDITPPFFLRNHFGNVLRSA